MDKENRILIFIFVLVIYGFLIMNLLNPTRAFSELENRTLTQKPNLTVQNLINGKFTEQYDKYVNDQFVFRDGWVGLKSDLERLIMKKENNNVYFGKDDFLLENIIVDEPNLEQNIQIVSQFANKTNLDKIYFTLVPSSSTIYSEMLPSFATTYDELAIIDKIKSLENPNLQFIDLFPTLNVNKDEYLYFRTDHHWTMRGAYYGYVEVIKSMGLVPYNIHDYHINTVTEDFYGTFYSKATSRRIKPDYIEVLDIKEDTDYTVTWVGTNKEADSVYEESHLDTKDKYSYFMDGNHPLTIIRGDQSINKKLLVIKDSYAHNFVPFLINHFEEIHVVDLRYFNYNIFEYIENNDISEILVLYGFNKFANDLNLKKLVY